MLHRPLRGRRQREDRRTKASHRQLCDVLEQLTTLTQLVAEPCGSYLSQGDMTQTVESDLMTAIADTPHKGRMTFRDLPHDEYCGGYVALLNEVQEPMTHRHEPLLLG